MTKAIKELEIVKLELEKNKSDLVDLDGFNQIFEIFDYTMNAISKYSQYTQKIDKFIE